LISGELEDVRPTDEFPATTSTGELALVKEVGRYRGQHRSLRRYDRQRKIAWYVSLVCRLAILPFTRTEAYGRYHTRTQLPAAPGAHETHKFLRYGSTRWRYALVCLFVTFSIGSLYGMWRVFTKSWVWYPLLAVLAINVLWTIFTALVTFRRPAYAHDAVLNTLDKRRDHPSVDVFLPVCGEDIEILHNTFKNAAELKWPGELQVYVMDDSPESEGKIVERIAAEYGFVHLRRPNRGEHKKGGAMNYIMPRSHGEIIAVLDADFAASPGYLEETVPYFDAPDVGIVQTSQYFDVQSHRTENWIARQAGVMQSMFFCWAAPGSSALDSAICVGSSSLCRRDAIEAAGGFANVSGGEDVVTGVACLGAGYKTIYVPLNLSKGLCPDTFASVVNQQYRWAASTYNLFFPIRGYERICQIFWESKMTLKQRVMFMCGMLYYAQSILGLIVTVVPSLIMLWFYPAQVTPGNYLPILPAMIGTVMLPLIALPGWRPTMLRLAMVYGVAHLLATIDSILGRISAWVPTGGVQHRKANRTPLQASIVTRGWVIASQALAWAAIARDLPIYGLSAYWAVILLTLIQGIIFGPLLLPGYSTVPAFQILRRLKTQKRDADYQQTLGQ